MSNWYRKGVYLQAYQFPMQPMRGQKFWPKIVDEPLKPPIEKRILGRPKSCKRKDQKKKKKDQNKKGSCLRRLNKNIFPLWDC